ncbi:Putative DNA-binding protein ESCAROLA [Dendrobium catenatum]|uniref:DNA-binding protein ESCAROLA n=1 Tax=Dendrobium catenatum TaxID=906689 RepID=A0A2I0VG27_9ASPA|nr:Putative DNA-binding protein ESCAROLA [Dendrobium catenatum]
MSTCCPNNATGKRKRGRQPGSKNKPKTPVANCMPHIATLHQHVLEIHAGGDVAETIAAFARGCRNFGVCVLSASGPIAGAVLWEASPYPSTLTFQGSFFLISFMATFLPGGSKGSMAVTLAGPHGQVLGGVVAGPVVAAGKVIVVAATFASSALHRFGAVNNTSTSIMMPVVGGEEGCGKSSAAKNCEVEKSEQDKLNKCLEELEQFLDLPPEVDGVFIGDGASAEKRGLDGGGEEVDGNMLENYLKELEHCLEVPADVEETTVGLDGDSGREGEGDSFSVEEYLDLEMMVDDAFGGSRDGCGEHFALDAFRVSGACLSLY